MMLENLMNKDCKVILVAGSSGYIGKKLVKKLRAEGHRIICPVREIKNGSGLTKLQSGVEYRKIDVCNKADVEKLFIDYPIIDNVISCIASRSGGLKDSWAVEFHANNNLLDLAIKKSSTHFILLSAICVQKPRLIFQKAKLAFERRLIRSEITYTIIRPTAFFKSISGQIERIKRGKSFIVFGNGLQTACKPISERDLIFYIFDSLTNASLRNRILPIGGPGDAITPLDQCQMIFDLLEKDTKIIKIPSFIFIILNLLLAPLAKFSQKIDDVRELMKIAHYYATESMLVWDKDNNRYDPKLTPETGKDTIKEFYKKRLDGTLKADNLHNQKIF